MHSQDFTFYLLDDNSVLPPVARTPNLQTLLHVPLGQNCPQFRVTPAVSCY